MATPRPITIDLPTHSVAALEWGPSDGPLAILLHGFPDTAHTWRHLGPHLGEQGWHVVAPFSRGYAPTGPAPDGNYELAALVSDVIDIYGALNGTDEAIVVGHDWGSAVASGVASTALGKFSAAVLMAVPPLAALTAQAWPPKVFVKNGPVWLRQLPRSWYMLVAQTPLLTDKLIETLWARWAPDYDYTQDLGHIRRALPTAAHKKAALSYYRALWNPLYKSAEYSAERRRVFGKPKVRTLCLHGADDVCIRAELNAHSLAVLPRGSDVTTIERAGHFFHLEQPQMVNSLIDSFVGSPRSS
ncbi:alpha/beta hydrolase [Hoyosella rhizosphaerae]|uniref:Epoxide hydrolase n=1 Tax=Hoyosella rhizosphaerae TaxID=1755582 RepID=A0A916UEA0_9ACTN|nr:alpha/beta hydrolase [Hoyosella rhizosphaerae]MBN4925683.1 alpha/beta hydrolase [Hoyosella rhizosphaerae]GGC68726.1 epoxide hydrolase [Hoyosella rhizosphaerae]